MPQDSCEGVNCVLLKITACVLLLKQELNQLKATSLIVNRWRSTSWNVEWPIQPNAVQHVAGSIYIVWRRTSTGVNGWWAAVTCRRCCGAHCRPCLDEIATYPAPVITPLTALRYFLLFAPTQLVCRHRRSRHLPRRGVTLSSTTAAAAFKH